MGSFNNTCAISKAPITCGDEVRLFFLVGVEEKHKHYSRSAPFQGCGCYPWDNFKILGLPVKATYEDYNNYAILNKDEETWIVDIIKNIYKPNRVEKGKTLEDYNEYHDYMNAEVEELDIQKILDMRHSGALRTKHYLGTGFINTMAVHESVFQVMLGDGLEEYDYKTGGYVKHSIEEIATKIYNEELTEKFTEEDNAILEDLRNELEKTIGTENDEGVLITEELVEKGVDRLKRAIRMMKRSQSSRRDYLYQANAMNASEDLGDAKKYSEILAETEIFINQMFEMNMELIPPMTSGQCVNFKTHAEKLKAISNCLLEIHEKKAEEYED